jgi:hypothetical protein
LFQDAGSNTLPAVLPAVDKGIDLAAMAMKLVDSSLPASDIPHKDGTIKAAYTDKSNRTSGSFKLKYNKKHKCIMLTVHNVINSDDDSV